MQIDIKPDDIDNMVKNAILQSAIGKSIEESVKEILKPHTYNNPINEKLRLVIGGVAFRLIEEKYKDKIEDLVAEHIEKMVTNELIENTVSKTLEKMERAARELY